MSPWPSTTIAGAFEIKPSKSEASRRLRAQASVSFVPMCDLGIGAKYFDAQGERTLSEVVGSYTYFADGDVLLAKITPCFENGKLGIARGLTNGVGFGSSEFIVLRSKGTILPEFLYYFLDQDSFRFDGARRMAGAVGHKRVTNEFIEQHVLPMPPLAEQQRLVALLDEAFAGIATATAHAERCLAAAGEVFERYLEARFIDSGIGWAEKKLGDICVVDRGSSPRPIKEYITEAHDGVNWIRIGDTKGDKKYVWSTREKITPEGALSSRYVKEGDLILTNSMSYGDPYIMKTTGYIHDGWFVLRPGPGIDVEYLYFALVSPLLRRQFDELACGAIVKNISGDLVKKAIVPVPPAAEQRLIVTEIEIASEECDRLASLYRRKLAALAELKQAVLRKAFAGEL